MKVSVITLAYNHQKYIRDALSSALAQTRPADEIIVLDDASSDGTADEILRFIGENQDCGIQFIRNGFNCGLTCSFEKALSVASGDIMVMMSGDDVSHSDRIKTCVDYFKESPSVMALISNAEIIDESSQPCGILDNCHGEQRPASLTLEDLGPGSHFLRGRSSCGAAAAYRRELVRSFKPLQAGLYCEDDPMVFRAMLIGSCDFLPKPLIKWRRHRKNLSNGGGCELSLHFRRLEATVDQMLFDSSVHLLNQPCPPGNGHRNAVSYLSFMKYKWALWGAAQESGARLGKFASASRGLFSHRPSFAGFLAVAWRPFFRMLTPAPALRLFRKIRHGI